MWLFLPDCFVSVVNKPGHDDLCVRARTVADLETFRAKLPGDGDPATLRPIETGTGTDYHCRFYASHDDVATALAATVRRIGYSNFKSQVSAIQGHERAHSYMGIWSIMMQVQRRALAAVRR